MSVCISTYNRSRYLRDAIDSVLAQTFGDFELIVSDDYSPDDTATVVAAYRDPRLRYVRGERNLGMVGNYNRCLRLARGEFIGIFDDDDMYLPTMLEHTVGALSAHPRAGFVYGMAEEVHDSGRPVGVRRPFTGDTVLEPPAAFAHLLCFNSVPQPTTLVRAQAYAAVGPYDEAIGWALDWDMWLRLASRFPIVYVDRPLARYRLTDESCTKSGQMNGSAAVSMRATVRKALVAPPPGKRLAHRVVRRARRYVAQTELGIAFGFLYRGDHRSFRKHALSALTFAPELLLSSGGLAAVALGGASLAGSRGPQFLWRLRDRVIRRGGSSRHSTMPVA